ncbi:amino acid adenylation domain-containing protein [Streptomyces sp. NPDC059783]|uniref:non-ribosomal peptide synthetase n=1 Tax=Streptomyces sp. NPDC059783 TaxID=3346944 RepID=UPI0036501863
MTPLTTAVSPLPAALPTLDGGSRTVTPAQAGTVHGAVALRAARTPGAVALYDGGPVTYAELDAAADALAAALLGTGIGREERVGVHCARGADFVIAALAALKAQAAYVPLDPSYPAEALERIASGAGLAAVVTAGPDGGALPDWGVPVVPVRGHAPAAPAAHRAGHGGQLMYLVFTSGSTGEPKGVAVTHADVLALAGDDARLAVRPGQRVAHLAPTAFDASVFEIWVTLCRGATVDVVPSGPVTVERLGGHLRERRPDWLFLTTGLFHAMADHDPDGLAMAGTILTGGDVLSPQHVRAIAARTRVLAAYGPTETTVFASLHTVDPRADHDAVPLGTPLTGMGMRVLGPGLEAVEDGGTGELCLSGAGLARGYFGAPGRTALRFVPDPAGTGERVYRTGDLSARRPDGEFTFHGRADRQVKIRGFRVELGEIETCLNQHPDIAAGVALAVPAPGGNRLVGYVSATPGRTVTPGGVRQWLGDRLPPHLVPGVVEILDAMPLDRNGKFDRGALDAPWASREALDVGEFRAPEGALQSTLAGAFADVLGIDRVGVDDDFFRLGGDSLRTVDLLAVLAEAGHGVRPRDFFRGPTVAELSALLASRAGTEG